MASIQLSSLLVPESPDDLAVRSLAPTGPFCPDDPLALGDTPPGPPDPTISVSMIVRNEEAMLGACLESVKDADEIVVVDTGSDDSTPALLQSLSRTMPNLRAFIGEYKWNDHFAEARNYAAAKCTKDWILIIDADETLEPYGIEHLRSAILSYSPPAQVLGFKCVSTRVAAVHYAPRAYRNHCGIEYRGAIHNHLSRLSDKDIDVVINYGYSPAHKKDPDRAMRILTREVERNPNAAREIFYLAREYFYLKDWKKAMELYRRYLTIGRFGGEIADAHLQIAKCLNKLGDGVNARREALDAIMTNADFREAWVFVANLSGPKNKALFLEHAKLARNHDVLFINPTCVDAEARK